MKFFAAKNLVEQTLAPTVPWEFKSTVKIPAQVRHSKEDRQIFYQSASTDWNFYTAIEGANPNQRPSRENTPHKIHAVSADYDLKIPEARALEAITAMKYKPTWVERSLGGNLRLVWLFERPILVDDYGFCAFILDRLVSWLDTGLLPGLDQAAFTSPSRLLCNGCEWKNLKHPPIPSLALQALFVECGKKYRFEGKTVDMPLDVVESGLRAKFPSFSWPSDFSAESQGPSFWVSGSTSSLSAIVKPDGMFSFSAHATKSFYSWSDILGADFVKQFQDNSIAKATEDVWWDSKRFWRKSRGVYISMDKNELINYLRVDCRLSMKPGNDGIAPIDHAFSHIFNHNRINAAVPFVFRPSGVLDFLGDRKLNTYTGKPVPPAEGTQSWGDHGNFPFLSRLFPELFEPTDQQPHFLGWFQHYYQAAFEQVPAPGQNVFFMGGAGVGKTLTNREIVGVAVGGYTDASDFLVEGGVFNSHLMRVPHWCLDDDSPTSSGAAHARFHAIFKKTVANQQFLNNEKFVVSGMTEWMGRIGCTTNLDYVSSRLVGPLDNSSLDKVNLFRCPSVTQLEFPRRSELIATIRKELPFFLRWLLDWEPPETLIRDSRYGFASFQERSLLDSSHQSSATMPFKEVLLETLGDFFNQNADAKEWVGTVPQLLRLIMMTACNDFVLKSLKLEQVSRYLEQIQKEGLLKCEVGTGPMKIRLWKFKRQELI